MSADADTTRAQSERSGVTSATGPHGEQATDGILPNRRTRDSSATCSRCAPGRSGRPRRPTGRGRTSWHQRPLTWVVLRPTDAAGEPYRRRGAALVRSRLAVPDRWRAAEGIERLLHREQRRRLELRQAPRRRRWRWRPRPWTRRRGPPRGCSRRTRRRRTRTRAACRRPTRCTCARPRGGPRGCCQASPCLGRVAEPRQVERHAGSPARGPGPASAGPRTGASLAVPLDRSAALATRAMGDGSVWPDDPSLERRTPDADHVHRSCHLSTGLSTMVPSWWTTDLRPDEIRGQAACGEGPGTVP